MSLACCCYQPATFFTSATLYGRTENASTDTSGVLVYFKKQSPSLFQTQAAHAGEAAIACSNQTRAAHWYHGVAWLA